MRFKRISPCLVIAALVLLLLPAAAIAQVSVFAEGAFTATDLTVYIYADITGSPLCSFGVALNYDSAKLTVNNDPLKTNINQDIWYFGSSPPGTACPNCVSQTSGKIVFIGGKLDTDNPTEGVIGTRKLLAKATFNRVFGQDTAFGISLALGKTHPPFDNFVTSVTPTVLDSPGIFTTVKIFERGDANGSGSITVRDIATVKELIGAENFPVYADCNDSGSITVRDIACIKEKLQ